MLIVEIAKYLHNNNLGIFDETGTSGNIFISVLPSKPEQCISIYQTGGATADVKLGYDNPTIQLIVRGTGHPKNSYDKALDIYNQLHGLSALEFIPGGSWIVSCIGLQSGPAYIGQDKNGRHEHSLNFILDVRNKSINRE